MQLEGRSTVQCDGFLVYIDYDTKILPVLSCSCPFAVDVGYADRQGSLERVHKREYKLEYSFMVSVKKGLTSNEDSGWKLSNLKSRPTFLTR